MEAELEAAGEKLAKALPAGARGATRLLRRRRRGASAHEWLGLVCGALSVGRGAAALRAASGRRRGKKPVKGRGRGAGAGVLSEAALQAYVEYITVSAGHMRAIKAAYWAER